MNRGVITISESGTVSMPTDTVWMTMQEIADMYNVFGCYVRKAVKAVFKDGILKEQGVRRHVRKNDRISYDVYSLELVIAVAFRIDSIESRAFLYRERNGIEQPYKATFLGGFAPPATWASHRSVLAWY